jgi:SAM-dependent methyltransferase
MERAESHARARQFFEQLWSQGDYWELETSPFEAARYDALLAVLGPRRLARVLEIGCGAGAFTRRLAAIADEIVALDVAPSAIARAQASPPGPATVRFAVANIMDYDLRAAGPFDLIVMTETIYYLGWLYSFFDVAWLALELFAATAPGGRLLLADTLGGCTDALLSPPIIRTYRDLFRNAGYAAEAERVFQGSKHGMPLEVLISLLARPPAPEGTGG